MKVKKFLLILDIMNMACGVLLALGPFGLFPVCEGLRADGGRMACFYSGILITSMGIFIVILSFILIIMMMIKIKRSAGIYSQSSIFVNNFLSVICAICAMICWMVPNKILNLNIANNIIGVCGNPEHMCRAVTMPVVGVIIVVIMLITVMRLIMLFIN